MSKPILILFLFVLVAQSCSQSEELIIFSSSRNGNTDIFKMDTDGQNVVALTTSDFEEWGPTWINAEEISFLRQTKDSILRIKLNLSTLEESRLEHPSNCILDDKNMLYSSQPNTYLYTCKNDIFVVDSKGSTTINITASTDGFASYPSWSNDGNKVIYTSNHLGSNEVFCYDLATKAVAQLTSSKSNNERGELSPDGQYLAYSSDASEKGNQDIILKNLKTNDQTNITNSPGMELIARFSGDGYSVYYGSNKDGNWEIYSYNIETKQSYRLTNNAGFDGDPRILKH